MARYSVERYLDVAPEVAYAYRRDFTNLPRYNPDVVDLVTVDERTYRFKLRMGPLRIPVTLGVTEEDPPHRLVCTIDVFMPAVEECRFEPTPAGTRLTFTTEVDSRSGPLKSLVDRLFVVPNGLRQVRRELDLMATLLQEPAAGSGSGPGSASGSSSP